MLEEELTRRKAPEGGQYHQLVVADGTSLRYGIWHPQTVSKRGTMLVLPGASEFIEKYFETIKKLLERGFCVVILDWRGQGLSNRPLKNPQKHHLESFDSYVSDLDSLIDLLGQLIKDEQLPAPLNALTHSMGGHNLLRLLHDKPHAVESAILSAPMIDIHFAGLPRWLVRLLTAAKIKGGKAEEYSLMQGDYDLQAGGNYKMHLLTHDKSRFEDEHFFIQQNPKLTIGGKTWGWINAALCTTDLINKPKYAGAITTPVHIVQAGKDRLVRNDRQAAFVANLPNATFDVIDGARHEILKERDEYQDQFWTLFDRYYPTKEGPRE